MRMSTFTYIIYAVNVSVPYNTYNTHMYMIIWNIFSYSFLLSVIHSFIQSFLPTDRENEVAFLIIISGVGFYVVVGILVAAVFMLVFVLFLNTYIYFMYRNMNKFALYVFI